MNDDFPDEVPPPAHLEHGPDCAADCPGVQNAVGEAASTGSIDVIALAKRLVQLRADAEALATKQKAIAQELDSLEGRVIDGMVDQGMQNLTVDGRMVYLSRKLWASSEPAFQEKLVRCLRRIGLGSLVTTKVNPSSLSSWARERVKDFAAANPDKLADPQDAATAQVLFGSVAKYIKVAERTDLGVRKA